MTVVPSLIPAQDSTVLEAVSQLLASNPDLQNLTLGDYLSMATPTSLPSGFMTRRLSAVPSSPSTDRQNIRSLLSDRELDVVRLVSEGLSNKEISYRLGLSDKTIKNHISHILAKLNLTARTQVAVLAIRGGFA